MQSTDIPLIESVGEITIKYNRKKMKLVSNKITCSEDAYDIFKKIFPPGSIEHREMMYALFLCRANTILGYACISLGGLSQTTCDPKIIFQLALKLNASGIVLAHNHPSGNLEPSEADIHLTKRIKEGAELMDFTLLDHLIIGVERHVSLADEGMI
jgi:DNA repair protein RadC